MPGRYLLALLLTLIIEGSVAYLLGLRKNQHILAVALVNVITNLTLNYLILVLGFLNADASLALIVVLEIVVVIVEWQMLVYVFRNPKGRFLIISILANTMSFFIGLLFFWT
jgi:hypothetical protein